MQQRHGDQFHSRGAQAETWIQYPPSALWTYDQGQSIVAQIGEHTKPDEAKYYAALLAFKDAVEQKRQQVCLRGCLPVGGESSALSRSRDTEIWSGGSSKLEEPLSPTFQQVSANGGARRLHDSLDIHAAIDPDVVCEEVEKRSKRTQLAALLEGLRHSPSIDVQIEAALGDAVDEMLHKSHEESQRHLPNAEDLLTNLGGNQRESILEWLVQACDIMRLPDAVLYSTVLLLDRYCTVAHEPLPMERMQKVLMAVICTVLKTCAIADEVTMPLRELLLHLCRRQVVFEEILVMEHRVLQQLQFSGITAPTVLDFLEALGSPLQVYGESAESSSPLRLAKFLVELSLFHASVHYRRPHAILAAASLYVSLCSYRCSPVAIPALLQDVEAVCWEMSDVPAVVVTCATELHSLWQEFATLQGQRVQCLLHKFSASRLQAAVLLSPPAALIPTTSAPSDTSQRLWRSHTPFTSATANEIITPSTSASTPSISTSRVPSATATDHSTPRPIGLNRWTGSHITAYGSSQAASENDGLALVEASAGIDSVMSVEATRAARLARVGANANETRQRLRNPPQPES
jgi:hypothetical protein